MTEIRDELIMIIEDIAEYGDRRRFVGTYGDRETIALYCDRILDAIDGHFKLDEPSKDENSHSKCKRLAAENIALSNDAELANAASDYWRDQFTQMKMRYISLAQRVRELADDIDA